MRECKLVSQGIAALCDITMVWRLIFPRGESAEYSMFKNLQHNHFRPFNQLDVSFPQILGFPLNSFHLKGHFRKTSEFKRARSPLAITVIYIICDGSAREEREKTARGKQFSLRLLQ